ncbi:peptidase inhibitor family I36 protein [Streptomyces sp. GMY02]|uniref:peptidase inhibitor family I36 protein n=1 Tax=Streptomyces sp. GMY02 TaxID=1333528 RepID=UPI001C2C6133|nr:peptidase inhibitor family I36 protein [Streptomyces sp. GMY02]QXE38760.1 peptidase inhibitor family I36 protein [Streptomyces sp. GMY02]
MRRIMGVALGAVALGVMSVMGTAPSALAAGPSTGSAAVGTAAVEGRFWIYEWPNYTGNEKSYNGNDRYFANDEWDGTSVSVDNLSSSAKNLTNRWAYLYQFGNSSGGSCSGDYVKFPPGSQAPDLGQLNGGTFDFNNKASCIIFI